MYKANADTRTHAHKRPHAAKHTLRSSASGFGCPSSNSLCLISSSSSFSRFLSRSSASISFSRSLRRFCSALPLEATMRMTTFRTIARMCALWDLGHTIKKNLVWSDVWCLQLQMTAPEESLQYQMPPPHFILYKPHNTNIKCIVHL